jgi:hypothetical protein
LVISKECENKAMIKCLLLLTLAFSFFTNPTFGCSLFIAPASDFDATNYIFIGEIVEEFEVEYGSRRVKNKAIGFKIRVSENIYSPKQATYFEVFPLSINLSCGLWSDTKYLRERFTVGSKVRVVAKETTLFKNQPVENSTIRLETSIRNRGSFSRNDLSEYLQSSAKSYYDYSRFVQEELKYLPEFELQFELQKDLLRLKESKSEDERTKVLERLVFYPRLNSLSFLILVEKYLKNQEKIATLKNQWKQRVQEEFKKFNPSKGDRK